jgi:hypothetical protein
MNREVPKGPRRQGILLHCTNLQVNTWGDASYAAQVLAKDTLYVGNSYVLGRRGKQK